MTIDSTRSACFRSTHRAIGYLVPAWDDALTAVLIDDTPAARRVMRTAAARRASIQLALAQTQRSVDVLDPSAPTDVASMHVLAEAARINRLLARLCQSVISRHTESLLAEVDWEPAGVLQDVGLARLEALESTTAPLVIDRPFVAGSRALTAAAQTLADGTCQHGRSAVVCHDLANSLLEASRLAARVA